MGFFDFLSGDSSDSPSGPQTDEIYNNLKFGSSSIGGDFGGSSLQFAGDNPNAGKIAPQPPAPNSSFTAGLNLLLSNPTAFVNTLFSDNADSVPTADIKRAATQSISANAAAGPGNPFNFPTWVKVTLIGGVAIFGVVAVGFLIHEVRKV